MRRGFWGFFGVDDGERGRGEGGGRGERGSRSGREGAENERRRGREWGSVSRQGFERTFRFCFRGLGRVRGGRGEGEEVMVEAKRRQ